MSTITKKELTDRIAQSTQVNTVAVKAIVRISLMKSSLNLPKATVLSSAASVSLNYASMHREWHRIQRPSNESMFRPNEQ